MRPPAGRRYTDFDLLPQRLEMTHSEFVTAYRRGEIRVEIDAPAAGRALAGRLMLPLVALPVLGMGVALALVGWIYTGLALIAVGFVVPRLIKRSAPHFLLQQALEEPAVYEELARSGLLRIDRDAQSPAVPGR